MYVYVYIIGIIAQHCLYYPRAKFLIYYPYHLKGSIDNIRGKKDRVLLEVSNVYCNCRL